MNSLAGIALFLLVACTLLAPATSLSTRLAAVKQEKLSLAASAIGPIATVEWETKDGEVIPTDKKTKKPKITFFPAQLTIGAKTGRGAIIQIEKKETFFLIVRHNGIGKMSESAWGGHKGGHTGAIASKVKRAPNLHTLPIKLQDKGGNKGTVDLGEKAQHHFCEEERNGINTALDNLLEGYGVDGEELSRQVLENPLLRVDAAVWIRRAMPLLSILLDDSKSGPLSLARKTLYQVAKETWSTENLDFLKKSAPILKELVEVKVFSQQNTEMLKAKVEELLKKFRPREFGGKSNSKSELNIESDAIRQMKTAFTQSLGGNDIAREKWIKAVRDNLKKWQDEIVHLLHTNTYTVKVQQEAVFQIPEALWKLKFPLKTKKADHIAEIIEEFNL